MKNIIFVLILFYSNLLSFDTINTSRLSGYKNELRLSDNASIQNIDNILRTKSFKYIKKLLQKNPSYIRRVFANKQTLMHKAVFFHRYELISYLVKKNVPVYKRDSNGDTPVHIALYNEDMKALRLLMRSKGFSRSLYIKNYLNVSPIDLSEKDTNSNIKDIFNPDIYIDIGTYKDAGIYK